MKYIKPILASHSALAVIQNQDLPKQLDQLEPHVTQPSDPAYQADE